MSHGDDFAKQLRQRMTDEERIVWSQLRNRRFAEFKFLRQIKLGSYVVDFVCFAARVIIELDGGQRTLQREYDAERTRWLEAEGFRVLRLWNYQVHEEWDAFEELLWRELHRTHHERP